MRITDIATDDLRRILADTEKFGGPDSASASELEERQRVAEGNLHRRDDAPNGEQGAG